MIRHPRLPGKHHIASRPVSPVNCSERSTPGVAAQWATGLAVLWLATALGPGVVQAQTASDTALQDTPTCVEVTVNGQRVPPLPECLTRKLQPAPKPPANPRAADAPLAAEAITQRPSNQLGLFNRAATGHRMGNQFGISAFPQRPPDIGVQPRPIPVFPATR